MKARTFFPHPLLAALLLATTALAGLAPLLVPGVVESGSQIPVHLQSVLQVKPTSIRPDGLRIQLSAAEPFDPDHPRWGPYYQGSYHFPTVFMGRGTLLVPTSDQGAVRSIGHLVPDEHGNLTPKLYPNIQVRLTAGGAHLVDAGGAL